MKTGESEFKLRFLALFGPTFAVGMALPFLLISGLMYLHFGDSFKGWLHIGGTAFIILWMVWLSKISGRSVLKSAEEYENNLWNDANELRKERNDNK